MTAYIEVEGGILKIGFDEGAFPLLGKWEQRS
jgi:hypothetical protein